MGYIEDVQVQLTRYTKQLIREIEEVQRIENAPAPTVQSRQLLEDATRLLAQLSDKVTKDALPHLDMEFWSLSTRVMNYRVVTRLKVAGGEN